MLLITILAKFPVLTWSEKLWLKLIRHIYNLQIWNFRLNRRFKKAHDSLFTTLIKVLKFESEKYFLSGSRWKSKLLTIIMSCVHDLSLGFDLSFVTQTLHLFCVTWELTHTWERSNVRYFVWVRQYVDKNAEISME